MVRLISEDEFTATWEGIDTRLDRPVVLRVLSENARHDEAARTRLRRAAQAPVLATGASDAYAPRILDGGDDPTLGPFLVAELNESFEATRPLPVAAAQPAPVEAAISASRAPVPRRRTGLIALALLIVI
jgi:hypothetical protein